MRRVLIVGCGYVGTALGRQLVTDGHEVFGVRRHVDDLPAGIHGVAADVADRGTLRKIPRNVDQVVYAVSPDGPAAAAYRVAYVDGPRHVLDHVGVGLDRFLYLSSTAVYGQHDGDWVTEATRPAPQGGQGMVLLEGEAVVRASGVGVVVRPGGIYGPGRTRLLRQVQAGKATYDPSRPRYTNRIHRDDLAGALRFLLAHAAPDPLYLGVDDLPTDRRIVLEWLAHRLGAPPPGRAPASPTGRGGNKRCSNARLREAGFTYRYPTFREGYPELIAAITGGDE